jgi:hypothetical protein
MHSTRSASDKVYQLLAHGRWFSPGTPASSTAKTDRHVIAEILLKVALKHQKSINQSIIIIFVWHWNCFAACCGIFGFHVCLKLSIY